MATFSDDFARPNSTDLGPGWLEVSGDWSINSNQLSPGSTGGTVIARAAATMGSNDHYVQVTIAATTAASHGLWCRGNSAGGLTTGYLLRNNGASWDLFTVLSGSFIAIGSYPAAAAPGDVVRLQVVGSSVKGIVNGAAVITVTDSAVPTGTSVGLRSESSAAIRFDDFTAADISSGTTLPLTPAPSSETAQPVTGTKTSAPAPATDTTTAQPLTGTKTANLTSGGETTSAQPLTSSKAAPLSPADTHTAAQVLAGTKSVPLPPTASIDEALALSGQKRTLLTPATEHSTAVGIAPPSVVDATFRPADRLTTSTAGTSLGTTTDGPVLAATSSSGG